MGYESKLIVGEAATVSQTRGTWVDVVAEYDLCNMGCRGFARLLSASKAERTDARRFYIFGYDGNEYIYKDLYDDELLPLNLHDTIEALESDGSGYRRLAPAVALLEAFRASPRLWRDLVVLHYGH